MRNGELLRVRELEVSFHSEQGVAYAVNGVNLTVNEGDSIGIVGESGCGKSVSAFSILRILPPTAKTSGEMLFRTRGGEVVDLAKLHPKSRQIRKIRGQEIALIFQEPMTAFSPVYTIGNQICEAILLHHDIPRSAARERAMDLLHQVGISKPEQRIDEYPFQLSGGMRQRAMIAMALSCNPRLLIADEPTTALDVTIQAQVLKLIKDIQQEVGNSLMLITHDLGVIAQTVDYIYVMYLGRVVEQGPVGIVFDNPLHPYTQALLKSIPKVTGTKGKLSSIKGTVPNSYMVPSGCAFGPRCQAKKTPMCQEQVPNVLEPEPNHYVSCFLYLDEGGISRAQHTG